MDKLDENNKFLIFFLGEERYAIPLLSAKEVIAPRNLTNLPTTSKIIKGIINLRGTIVTMIDLKSKIGIFSKELKSDSSSFIILDDQDFSFGIIVDSIDTVLSFSANQLEDLPTDTTKIKENHTNRLAKVENKIILILNIKELIQDLVNKNKTISAVA